MRALARPLRILVVDDNVDGAQMLAELLQVMGHDVAVAHDGLDAKSAFARTRPHLAFLDLDLPRLDGVELARQLRSDFEHAALVALTARDGVATAPFSAYVRKPADLATLKAIIAAVQQARDLLAPEE